ncbi:hypothetical protein BGZ57DRAFT_878490 [Hyaloscypha finlandica]|nr:hypothetical protein BGZ57DRAFT_878490 [Hyaloscypha finlandica]KAH8802244.1 hypothetical protein F5882DRAFT_393260 [Hyaloscypha sp. PMI_1271]
MSGLEIPALVFGIVGAAAGSASAYKDVTRKGEGSLYKVEKTIQTGNSVSRQTDVVYCSGNGTAMIKRNGDMVASSSGKGSSAVAYSKGENAKTWGK